VTSVVQLAADPLLPALAAALSPARMRREFDCALLDESASARYRIVNCEVERVRYKAGQKCVICYALFISDLENQSTTRQYVSARVFPQGQSASRYRKALRQDLVAPPLGRPVMHIEHLDMVAWTFPNERKLAGLPELAGPGARVVGTLRDMARARFGADSRVREFHHRILHYVPEHTCTARVVLTVDTGAAVRDWTVYGKTYQDDSGREVFARMRDLAAADRPAGKLRLPLPLAWDDRSRTLWQEGLDGEVLGSREPGFPVTAGERRRIAGAIATLHGIPVASLARTGITDALDDLRARAGLVAASLPCHAGVLDGLVDDLARSAPAATEAGTLHGDLHPGNVFLGDDGVALIDLDAVHHGPVLADLGSWGAGDIYRCLLAGGRLDDCLARYHAFVDDYAVTRGRSFARRDVDWFLALMLVRERCARSVSRLKAGRIDIVGRMLDLAVALAGADRRPRAAAAGGAL